MRIDHMVTIKSMTNNHELCKQVFIIAKQAGMDDAMIVRKRVLVDVNETLYKDRGYKLLRAFKGKGLYEQVSGIKLKTLKEVFTILSKQ